MFVVISLLLTCAAGRVGSQANHCLDPEQRGCSLQKHQKTAGMFPEEGGAQAPKAPPPPPMPLAMHGFTSPSTHTHTAYPQR